MTRQLLLALVVLILVCGEYCSSEILSDKVTRTVLSKTPKAVFQKLKSSLIDGIKHDQSRIDIVFVMDSSGSIGQQKFNLEEQFVFNLLEYFPVFSAKTRIAIVSYASNVKLEFNFKKYQNVECIRKGIKTIKYTGGLTATGNALNYVQTTLIFNSNAGARTNAKKIIFLLTDGKSNKGITPRIPANVLKGKGVVIFALGVTNYIKQSELLSIASGPKYVFHLNSFAALNQVTALIKGDISKKCRHGQTVYDECGRRCTCLKGRLVKCCRVRKEFTDMTRNERVRYINTVKTASTHATYKTRYEQLLTIHKDIFYSKIHDLDYFLPWHRWVILQYENLLREIDCRVTVPYWDWSLVGASPFTSDVWNTGPHGFGGDGNPSCVTSGPFRAAIWSLIASAGGGCLKRNFNGVVPTALDVQNLIISNSASTQFINFETLLRQQFHEVVECRISGTMCTTDSAAAPEFFLHHGFTDKIWWDWQRQSNAHKFNTYFTTQEGLMPSTGFRSRDFLDLNNQPGCVCAEYADPSSNAYKTIKGMSVSQIRTFPRLHLPPLSKKAQRLYRTTKSDVLRAVALRKTLSPVKTLFRSSLQGKDALVGFHLTRLKIVIRARHTIVKIAAADEEEE